MARPAVNHSGFLVPNAGTVADPRLAEPDRIDFNTLGNARWGVLTGCEVTGSGAVDVAVGDGTAMVNGAFVYVEGRSDLKVSIPTAATKFDLVVVNDKGQLSIHTGKESNDPTYPDPFTTETVLAAVYCKEGLNLADYVIDKRKFLQPALLTRVTATSDLIRNFANPGETPSDPLVNYIRMYGDGHMVWLNDTHMYRESVGKLRIRDNLEVVQDITADTVNGRLVTATAEVTGKNLRRETSFPAISTARKGDILARSDLGTAYIANPHPTLANTLEWDEIATMGNMMPVGTVIYSLEWPSRMEAKGWLQLNGDTIFEADYPRLFNVGGLSHRIVAGTVAPNRQMVLPNITGRVPMATNSSAQVGRAGPTPGGKERAANTIILAEGQMPKHKHYTDINSEQIVPAGVLPNHSHLNADDGHVHEVGLARISGATLTPTTEAGFGGNFYDAVLTPVVNGSAKHKTQSNRALIIVGGLGNPVPTIALSMAKMTHDHGLTEDFKGASSSIDITPNFFAVYAFVRS